MYAGDITINGKKIGIVDVSLGDPDKSAPMMDGLGSPEMGAGQSYGSGSGGNYGGHTPPIDRKPASPVDHKHNSIRYGHHQKPGSKFSDTGNLKGTGSHGKLNDDELYKTLYNKVPDNLIGHVPADGEKFGIRTGSREEWAKLQFKLAQQESGGRTAPGAEDSRHHGTAGLFQFEQKDLDRHGQRGKSVTDPIAQIDAMNDVFRRIPEGKGIGDRTTGGAAYFGPLRDTGVNRGAIAKHNAEGERVAARNRPMSDSNVVGANELKASPGRHPNISHVDPRLREIVAAGSKHLPPGYTLGVNDAFNLSGHAPHSQHKTRSGALDVQIFDPQGNKVPNRGNDPTGLYTRLARASYGEMQSRHPELKGHFAWGGSFGTSGGSGVRDLMHFDLGGERGNLYPHMSQLGALPNRQYGVATQPTPTKSAEKEARDESLEEWE